MAESFPATGPEELAEEVCRAAEATGDEKLKAPPNLWEGLRRRLAWLLGPKTSLWLAAKASVILGEHGAAFLHSEDPDGSAARV